MAENYRPATTPEAETQELIALATTEVRKRIKNGTAASQILAIYANEGTPIARLKQKKLENEIILLEAKTKAIQEASDGKALLDNALVAFKSYSGNSDEEL